MRKSLVIAAISISSLLPQITSACDKVIDPSKVMLFIDTNLSLKEVEVAKKGACDRGERFVLHPDGELADKARRTFYNFLTKEEYYNNKCKNSDTPACDKLYDEVEKLKETMDDYDFEEYEMTSDNIKKALASVKDSKATISTLIVSGHDGGGEISGDYIKGAFTKSEFFEVYDEVYSGEEKKDLSSILLWGCYTGTYSEATDWKSQFPNAKAIVGFYDSAPLATRPASADLMLDFLQKEHDLYKIEDEQTLKKSIQGLKSILYTQPGMLINACHDEEIYYSHFQDGDRRKTFYLTPKDADAQCKLVQDEWAENKKGVYQYYLDGNREIPDNIRGSDIRQIYGLVRQNEKCFKDSLNIDANKVGLLLFWNGVRENFSQKYAEELAAAQKEIEEIVSKIKPAEDAANLAYSEYNELARELLFGVNIFSGDEALLEQEKRIEEKKKLGSVYEEISKYTKLADLPEELRAKVYEKVEYGDFLRDIENREIQRTLKGKNDKVKELGRKLNEANAEAEKWRPFRYLGDIKFPQKGDEKYPRGTLVSTLRRLNDVFPTHDFQRIKEQYPNIEKAYKKMDQLLFQLDPSCMNFLEWHQFNPNKPLPRNQCEEK